MTTSIDDLLRPLSARSVIASALLGTHPPQLRGRLLVALAEEFGIGGGTARVALSRMVERGELTNSDGSYALSGSLARRQERQDLGRVDPATADWNGSWEQAIVVESGRVARDRSRLRQTLVAARLGEIREGVWMRPANLERIASDSVPDELAEHVMWFNVAVATAEVPTSMITQIFDLTEWSSMGAALRAAMRSPAASLADRFRLAAAVLQHLTRDPLLPIQLQPADWPGEELRSAYTEYERTLQADLRAFFSATASVTPQR